MPHSACKYLVNKKHVSKFSPVKLQCIEKLITKFDTRDSTIKKVQTNFRNTSQSFFFCARCVSNLSLEISLTNPTDQSDRKLNNVALKRLNSFIDLRRGFEIKSSFYLLLGARETDIYLTLNIDCLFLCHILCVAVNDLCVHTFSSFFR